VPITAESSSGDRHPVGTGLIGSLWRSPVRRPWTWKAIQSFLPQRARGENLDPKSVFDELVPHFREARKRRQVIIVTHNANLVVNTDADQVIVARSERLAGVPAPDGHTRDQLVQLSSSASPG
jgi:hypothetical protein